MWNAERMERVPGGNRWFLNKILTAYIVMLTTLCTI
jgi:hypothetical protein